jgi:NAD(P)-dependent dehydrogenase (short-subunit alcohol dehydrogenase family)
VPFTQNAVVVVTGGGTGVGAGLAREAHRRGARVVIAAPDPATETVEAITAAGGQAVWIRADVSQYADMQALATSVTDRFGAVNMVINNAVGSGGFGRLQEADPEQVKRSFEINILGVFNGIHAFYSHLKAAADRGEFAHVLNVGSEHSFGVPPFVPPLSAYTVSKYTSLGFTDAARRDFQGSGVGVSILAPSYVLTEGLQRVLVDGPEEFKQSAQGRYQTTEEVARRAFDGVLRGQHIIATNPKVSGEFAQWYSRERLQAFDEAAEN